MHSMIKWDPERRIMSYFASNTGGSCSTNCALILYVINQASRRLSTREVSFFHFFLTCGQAVMHRKHIIGLILRWTRKINSDISPTSFLNFIRSKSVEFGLDFQPQSPYFRNGATYMKSKSGSAAYLLHKFEIGLSPNFENRRYRIGHWKRAGNYCIESPSPHSVPTPSVPVYLRFWT